MPEQVQVGSKTTSRSGYTGSFSDDGSSYSNALGYAETLLGVRYRPGGTSTSGFDCSGFTQYVYSKLGVSLPHSAASQSTMGVSVSSSSLKSGDLVFFDTNGGHNGVNHVGIYIGGGKFIDANSSHPYAVTVDDLNSGYWSNTYMSARRVLN